MERNQEEYYHDDCQNIPPGSPAQKEVRNLRAEKRLPTGDTLFRTREKYCKLLEVWHGARSAHGAKRRAPFLL